MENYFRIFFGYLLTSDDRYGIMPAHKRKGKRVFKIGDWIRVSVDGVRVVEACVKEVYKDRYLVETANGYSKWIGSQNILGLL